MKEANVEDLSEKINCGRVQTPEKSTLVKRRGTKYFVASAPCVADEELVGGASATRRTDGASRRERRRHRASLTRCGAATSEHPGGRGQGPLEDTFSHIYFMTCGESAV